MCTLSFIPHGGGYVVAMNRDERLTRVEALPPASFHVAGVTAIYPHEPAGGTWIAANEHRVTLAVLNLGDSRGTKQRSRGEVIPALIESPTSADVVARLQWMDLTGMLPFRLVGFFARERRVIEWRWDGWDLRRRSFPWRRQHWFSSGLSDTRAGRHRRPVFEAAGRRASSNSRAWLRRVHRSHDPAPGPFSVCVHRNNARTRSYTEVVCRGSSLRMEYLAGSPCQSNGKRGAVAILRLRP